MEERRGPLRPTEIATCGAMVGLAVTLGILAAVMPVFNIIFQAASAVPLAMVATRLRPRTTAAAFFTTVLMSLAIGGINTAWVVAQSALVGVVVGALRRKGIGWFGAVVTGLVLGLIGGLAAVGLLWLLADLRDLFLDSAKTTFDGYLKLVGRWDVLAPSAQVLREFLYWLLNVWWVWLPIVTLVLLAALVWLAHWLLGAVLSRIDLSSGWDPLMASGAVPSGIDKDEGADAGTEPPRVLPVSFKDVSFKYPTASAPALVGINLAFEVGGFTVIEGPNGSGKSTLALLLAGAQPSAGTVTRPGGVGGAAAHLGEIGGTALVSQRSELQMLGETVAEDVLWGLAPNERDDVDLAELLTLVGLDGKEEVLTRHLSGGQLQRLALAGALVRKPVLLISDESTAMIDQSGREELLEILTSLPARGTTVIHVTHDPVEAASADRRIRLEAGNVVFDSAALEALPPDLPSAPSPDCVGDVAKSEHGVDDPLSASPAVVSDTPDTATNPIEAPPSAPTGLVSDTPNSSPALVNNESNSEPALAVHQERARWPKAPEALWADRIAHSYDVGTPWQKDVLHDVSLILNPGDATLITGDNGSGKTTLSRILTGLVAPTWGKCTLGAQPMTARIGGVALSMQFARLQLQRPNVRTDILSAAGIGPSVGTGSKGGKTSVGTSRQEADELVESAMRRVGLDPDLARRNIDELSGGQMRRVALAGLLASNPQVLILDEPMAGLDQESREILVSILEKRRKAGLSVLVISHDTADLESLCERHLHLADGVLA
ncbi:DUF2232 domain-containing protein [Schaalia vaccimaxillae]|uniref:ABC transporter ATP-binding protein n=1 Tax=Schaalia vaccimaxillae TaxID=183916 RepID=UPI0003B7623E|nr:DUF2232 domain-containing protein [Schaalia vaccimaxillae]